MKRTTPMKPSSKPLARGTSTLTRSAMKPGSAPMKRAAKPMRTRSKTNAKREKGPELALCRGQPCYLAIPGVCIGGRETVPCHSNQGEKHGKGMGIKAHDIYTVPGCAACHHMIDQHMRFTKAEKFAFWDAAFARWESVRAKLMSSKVVDATHVSQ